MEFYEFILIGTAFALFLDPRQHYLIQNTLGKAKDTQTAGIAIDGLMHRAIGEPIIQVPAHMIGFDDRDTII